MVHFGFGHTVHIHSSTARDDTPWPNTVPALTDLFVAMTSWPIPPNVSEVPTSTFVKMEKSDEKTPPKLVQPPCNGTK